MEAHGGNGPGICPGKLAAECCVLACGQWHAPPQRAARRRAPPWPHPAPAGAPPPPRAPPLQGLVQAQGQAAQAQAARPRPAGAGAHARHMLGHMPVPVHGMPRSWASCVPARLPVSTACSAARCFPTGQGHAARNTCGDQRPAYLLRRAPLHCGVVLRRCGRGVCRLRSLFSRGLHGLLRLGHPACACTPGRVAPAAASAGGGAGAGGCGQLCKHDPLFQEEGGAACRTPLALPLGL